MIRLIKNAVSRRGMGAERGAKRGAAWSALVAMLALVLAGSSGGFWPRTAAASERRADAGKAPFAAQFAIADFDGDAQPDLASVQAGAGGNNRVLYLIDFRLSSGLRWTYGLTASPGGVRLASRDVNGDDLPDVVVTSSLTGEPLAVFVSDGRGNFTRSAPEMYPEAYRATGTSLAAQDDGTDDRGGAEISRAVPAKCESNARIAVPEKRPFLTATDFCRADDAAQKAWLGRAPPDCETSL
jgi:hypothetical protein